VSNKILFKTLGWIIYTILTFGFLGPWLISQPSTITFIGGIIAVAILPAFIINNYIRKYFKNEKTV
jgi:hypothetical protein